MTSQDFPVGSFVKSIFHGGVGEVVAYNEDDPDTVLVVRYISDGMQFDVDEHIFDVEAVSVNRKGKA